MASRLTNNQDVKLIELLRVEGRLDPACVAGVLARQHTAERASPGVQLGELLQ